MLTIGLGFVNPLISVDNAWWYCHKCPGKTFNDICKPLSKNLKKSMR